MEKLINVLRNRKICRGDIFIETGINNMKSRLLMLLAVSVVAAADKSGNGLAMHAGFGSMYGGLGVCVEYQFALRPLFRLTPFAAVGAAQPIYGGFDPFGFGFGIGVNAEVGRLHRVFISPHFSTQYLDYDEDTDGTKANKNTVVGPAVALGYKGTARFGLLWQVFGGVSYPVNDEHKHENSFAPVFGLGLGYKF